MRPSRSRFLRRTLTLGLLLIVYRASVTVTSIVSFISRLSRVRQTIKYPGVQLIARASTIHGRIAAARRRHQRARYGSATEAQRCSQRRRTIQRYHVWIAEPLGNLKWFPTQPNIAFAIMQHDVLDLRWNCNAGFGECRDNDLSKKPLLHVLSVWETRDRSNTTQCAPLTPEKSSGADATAPPYRPHFTRSTKFELPTLIRFGDSMVSKSGAEISGYGLPMKKVSDNFREGFSVRVQ